MALNLTDYGIEQSDIDMFSSDPSGLVKLRAVFQTLTDSGKALKLDKEEVAAFKEEAKKDEEASELVKSAMSAIHDAGFSALDENSNTVVGLIEELETFVSIMRFELKELLMGSTTNDALRASQTKDDAENYEACEKLRTLILSVWNVQRNLLDLSSDTFKEEGGFPLKTLKSGEIEPALPRMPDKPGAAKKGRPVHSSKLRFKWNGELVENLNGAEIARTLVTNRRENVMVSWKNIREAIEAQGKDLSKDSWSLEFKTGTLEGFVEKAKEVTSKSAPKK